MTSAIPKKYFVDRLIFTCVIFKKKFIPSFTHLAFAPVLSLLISHNALIARQTESVLSSSKEIKLSYHKNEALEKDRPYSDVLFDRGTSVWMLGRNYIWRWDVGKRSLQKLGCPILSNIAA